jgi:hypothetical protein
MRVGLDGGEREKGGGVYKQGGSCMSDDGGFCVSMRCEMRAGVINQ